MPKQKRKLTPAAKRAKKKRREETMIIFINGKQKRVKREPMIDGMSVDEFVKRNADPIWQHQEGHWQDIKTETSPSGKEGVGDDRSHSGDDDDDVPF